MVDASSSIGGEANFKLVIEFVKTIFHSFTMSATLRYGFVIFGSSAKVRKGFEFGKMYGSYRPRTYNLAALTTKQCDATKHNTEMLRT